MAAKKSTLSFDALLGQTIVPGSDSSKKKKEIIPVIKLDSDKTKNLKEFLENKKKMKEYEGLMRIAEQPLLSVCIDKMDTDGLTGVFNHSYEVLGDDGTSKVKFISVDKFGISQEEDNLAVLKDTLRPEVFEQEVLKKPSVTMKAEVYSDEKLQKELVQLMGENFSKFFQTTITYSLKPGFNERIYGIAKSATNTDIFQKAIGLKPISGYKEKLEQIKSLTGQSKPFFK